jgi:hypothetical protein
MSESEHASARPMSPHRRMAWAAGIAVTVTAGVAVVAVAVPKPATGNGTTKAPAAADRPARVLAAPDNAKGIGRDALTQQEVDKARQLALNADRPLRLRSENVQGDGGPAQYLRTELADPAETETATATSPRRAEVYFYDYKDDTLTRKTVNLNTGKVESTKDLQNLQPPPSVQESREAVELLLKSPLSAGLKTDFKAATGKSLTKPEQLSVKGMSYNAGLRGSTAKMQECGKHRCVRMFTRVAGGGPWIDTTKLAIDLSARSVGRV